MADVNKNNDLKSKNKKNTLIAISLVLTFLAVCALFVFAITSMSEDERHGNSNHEAYIEQTYENQYDEPTDVIEIDPYAPVDSETREKIMEGVTAGLANTEEDLFANTEKE